MLVDYKTAAMLPMSPLLFHKQNNITIPLTNRGFEMELPNSIKI